MKKKAELIIGLFALAEVVDKLIKCPGCEDNLLMFKVPGYVHMLFWGGGTIVLFYNFYRANWGKKEEEQSS